jgi:hypothetical protein
MADMAERFQYRAANGTSRAGHRMSIIKLSFRVAFFRATAAEGIAEKFHYLLFCTTEEKFIT